MQPQRHTVSRRLFTLLAIALLAIALVWLPLRAEGPVLSEDAPALNAPMGRGQEPAIRDPQADLMGLPLEKLGPLSVSRDGPRLMDDCYNYVTNSELSYLDAWTVLDENVYWSSNGYVSSPHSALMLDGDDSGLTYDDSPEIDSFAQAFAYPDIAVSSIEIWFCAAFGEHDNWDDLYYSLYSLTGEGYLDDEIIRWGPVVDAGDEDWHQHYGTETDMGTLAPLRGQDVALVFWTSTDGEAPYEYVYLDDITFYVCVAPQPSPSHTPTLEPTPTATQIVGQTPSPTPTLPAGALVRDGDFENGDWSEWSGAGAPTLDTSVKHGGQYAARLGGVTDGADWIAQQVDIPSGTTSLTLSWWSRVASDESWTGYDYVCATLWDSQSQVAWQVCYDAGQGSFDWAQEVVAFSASEVQQLRGQSYMLQFYVGNDYADVTTAWFDDIQMTTQGGSAPPTAQPTARPTIQVQADLFPSDITVNQTVKAPGGTLDYTITLKNQGDASANQVVMSSTMSQWVGFDSWITPGGATHVGNRVEWSGDLAPGQEHVIAYRVVVSSGAPAGTQIENVLTFVDSERTDYPERRAVTTISTQTEYKTLIVTHSGRLSGLYGSGERDQVMTALSTQLAPHSAVNGLVLDLNDSSSVNDAYSTWLANATNENCSKVCDAIWLAIDGKLREFSTIEYIVLVGNDLVVPMRRVTDATRGEGMYPYDIAGDNRRIENVTELALNTGHVLTDDFYADRQFSTPSGWDHPLYLPDLAIGRLIETPSEIRAQIDAFAANSAIVLDNGVVTNQAIAPNGARMGNVSAPEICRLLTNAGISSDCTEIATKNEPDATTISKVIGTRRDVRVMIEHANHYNVGIDASTDIAAASASLLERSLFYTVGCHAGLNVPDTDSPGGRPLDLAQALTQKGATYFAGTGYGLGLLNGQIGLTERLLVCLTEQLTSGTTTSIGKAVVAAKQDYWSHYRYENTQDEKILVQMILYGLPMRSTGRSASGLQAQDRKPLRSAGLSVATRDLASGEDLSKQRVTFYDYALTRHDETEGSYYSFGDPATGTLNNAGLPVQPRLFQEFALQGTQAHGAALYEARYHDLRDWTPFIPQVAWPALNLTESQRAQTVPLREMAWYPALPHAFSAAGSESLATLLLAAGQYNPQAGKQRLYDEISANVYYSNSDDWVPPVIRQVTLASEQSLATISVQVTDTGSGVEEVLLTSTDGSGYWRTILLKQSPGGAWQGSLPAPTGLDYIVQAVDKAGNVTVDDNEGHYYLVGGGSGDAGWIGCLPLVIRD